MARERTLILSSLAISALQKTALSRAESVVLWHLVATLPAAGEVIVEKKLAAELSVGPMTLSRTMKRLRVGGMIERLNKIGTSYHYRLNPAYFRLV